jgi:hypothetical protein
VAAGGIPGIAVIAVEGVLLGLEGQILSARLHEESMVCGTVRITGTTNAMPVPPINQRLSRWRGLTAGLVADGSERSGSPPFSVDIIYLHM